jgi:hypothetical protein
MMGGRVRHIELDQLLLAHAAPRYLSSENRVGLRRVHTPSWYLAVTLPAYSADRLASLKRDHELAAKSPSNLRYSYVRTG